MNCPSCRKQFVFVETVSRSSIFSIEDLTEEKLEEKIKNGDYEVDDWDSDVVVICNSCGETIYKS